MLICQGFFDQESSIQKDVLELAKFIVYIYFPNWFKCTRIADAPLLTLQLHQDLRKWKKVDKDGAKAAMKKVDLHTDYLSGRSVVLAFASKRVSNNTKVAMAKQLFNTNDHEIPCGKPTVPLVYKESKLQDFVNAESWLFFKLLNFEPLFLNCPVGDWHKDASYKKFCSLVDGFTPVNDAAERAVKLFSLSKL